MTLDLNAILLFGAAALLYSAVLPARWHGWALLAGSVVAIYWLQPPLPIRFSDFILPTATIALTGITWWFTRKPDDPAQTETLREDRITLAVIAALVVGLSLMRFVEADYRITASRPPSPLPVVIALVAVGAATAGVSRLAQRRTVNQKWLLTGLALLLVTVFVALKAEPLAAEISRLWRGQTGQDTTVASSLDLNWLGFSYVAFRLIHTVGDRQSGILPVLSLREFATYVLFFPAFVAGPIDRAERFNQDLRALPDVAGLDASRISDGATRIAIGLAKKFVIADTLAQGLALNPLSAAQADSSVWLWALLYGYALRLYFDFSGYTDIAIGLGILFGVRLPDNFNRPYLKTSITAFWQSWHMTLSNWVRFYVFSPLSRWLLTREAKPSAAVIVLVTQLAAMVTIGLWHGVTGNFLLWGVWHGLGLFVHKQWSDRTRRWYRSLNDKPRQKQAWSIAGWLLTFHFVLLGWVWFALPDVELVLRVLGGLFGLR